MNNPLTSPGDNYGPSILLDEGEHICKLKKVDHIKDKWKKDDGSTADALRFTFTARDNPQAYISKLTSVSSWAKKGNESGLVKLMQQLDIKGLRACEMSEENVYDTEPLWALVQAQVGKEFVLFIEPTDKYNNFSIARPYVAGDKVEAAPKPVAVDKAAAWKGDPDDIPFAPHYF